MKHVGTITKATTNQTKTKNNKRNQRTRPFESETSSRLPEHDEDEVVPKQYKWNADVDVVVVAGALPGTASPSRPPCGCSMRAPTLSFAQCSSPSGQAFSMISSTRARQAGATWAVAAIASTGPVNVQDFSAGLPPGGEVCSVGWWTMELRYRVVFITSTFASQQNAGAKHSPPLFTGKPLTQGSFPNKHCMT